MVDVQAIFVVTDPGRFIGALSVVLCQGLAYGLDLVKGLILPIGSTTALGRRSATGSTLLCDYFHWY